MTTDTTAIGEQTIYERVNDLKKIARYINVDRTDSKNVGKVLKSVEKRNIFIIAIKEVIDQNRGDNETAVQNTGRWAELKKFNFQIIYWMCVIFNIMFYFIII